MTVYNVNLGIGWASSGVEYAQAYRSKVFSRMQIPTKFIFSDLILADNIAELTRNLGFHDQDVIWLYNFFTDVKIAPTTYPLSEFKRAQHFAERNVEATVQNFADGKQVVHYWLPEENLRINVRIYDLATQAIDYAEYVVDSQMVRREFYSYIRYVTEYLSAGNHVYARDFYNEDGSIAYHQYVNGTNEVFELKDQIFYSKTALYAEMIRRLKLTAQDLVILDREDGRGLVSGQLWYQMHSPAKLGVVVHAEHYDEHYTNQTNILWNNYYEYQFTHADQTDCFIVSTPAQKRVLAAQMKKYQHQAPQIAAIPVGSLTKLMPMPYEKRRRHSLITASRLASEKHVDWLIKAVVQAKRAIQDVSLDIYGQGAQHTSLQRLIDELQANEYVHLKGQQNLTAIYQHYAGYIAASTSEGFGLSLMEAVGLGLPMIGFDVPYGNQTFIDPDQNGYRLPYQADWSEERKVKELANAIVSLFSDDQWAAGFSQHSYELAQPYLDEKIAQKWRVLVNEVTK